MNRLDENKIINKYFPESKYKKHFGDCLLRFSLQTNIKNQKTTVVASCLLLLSSEAYSEYGLSKKYLLHHTLTVTATIHHRQKQVQSYNSANVPMSAHLSKRLHPILSGD